MFTDAELVAYFQAGDEDAFTAIYRRHAPRLIVYIWRRCGDWHQAEDLVQEAMLKAARYIPHGTMYDLNGYLILCVRQVWWMRAEQMRKRPAMEPFDPHACYRGQTGFVEDRVLERETIGEVARLLSHLEDGDRRVAVLRLFYGCDGRESAAILDTSRNAVNHRWERMRKKWRKWAGTKSRYAALDQALILAAEEQPIPPAHQCRVKNCTKPRHAFERCYRHAEDMRRQQTKRDARYA